MNWCVGDVVALRRPRHWFLRRVLASIVGLVSWRKADRLRWADIGVLGYVTKVEGPPFAGRQPGAPPSELGVDGHKDDLGRLTRRTMR